MNRSQKGCIQVFYLIQSDIGEKKMSDEHKTDKQLKQLSNTGFVENIEKKNVER
jgi:hypothetical protein